MHQERKRNRLGYDSRYAPSETPEKNTSDKRPRFPLRSLYIHVSLFADAFIPVFLFLFLSLASLSLIFRGGSTYTGRTRPYMRLSAIRKKESACLEEGKNERKTRGPSCQERWSHASVYTPGCVQNRLQRDGREGCVWRRDSLPQLEPCVWRYIRYRATPSVCRPDCTTVDESEISSNFRCTDSSHE